MEGFKYKNGHWVCPKCGSAEVDIFPGMTVDRFVCMHCGPEDYS